MINFTWNLKAGDKFQILQGWWISISKTTKDKIYGYFGNDQWSMLYNAVWDKETGAETTDPKNPFPSLDLLGLRWL